MQMLPLARRRAAAGHEPREHRSVSGTKCHRSMSWTGYEQAELAKKQKLSNPARKMMPLWVSGQKKEHWGWLGEALPVERRIRPEHGDAELRG